ITDYWGATDNFSLYEIKGAYVMKMIKNNHYRNENGFTLVEVLASIVIISVIMLGVVQLMSFTNKTAASNNSKLVTTHLAKATIERIKMQPETYFPFNEVVDKTYTKENCKPEDCEDLYQLQVN